MTDTASLTQSRVLLVDDHAMVRDGLRRLINDQADMITCATADSVDSALAVLRSSPVDVVVLDLALRGASGLDLLAKMRQGGISLPVLILSMHDETVHAERALRAGARGYIMKEEAPEELVSGIRQVLSGDVRLSDQMTRRLVRRMVDGPQAVSVSPLESLSDRELEIYRLIGTGYGPTEIAQKLGLSVKTVETHRDHIKKKLNVRTAAELIRLAVAHVNGV